MRAGAGMTQADWTVVKDELRQVFGENNYANWIAPLTYRSLDAGVLTCSVPSNFIGNYVSQNFADRIVAQLARHGYEVDRLFFEVSRTDAPRPAAMAVAAPAQVRSGLVESAKLDTRFTFDTFVVGKPNALAHAAARRVAEGGPVAFNPLFLYGGVGLGKTHLMHAIAHELRTNMPHLDVLYLSADQFMYRFVTALRERKIMDFKQLFRSVDVLMVDDVQFLAGKDSTQEEFFHTFNALVDQSKQVIISADRAPSDIKDLEGRISSRLASGLVVDLHPTDYELRLGILQSKVEQYREQYPGLMVATGVLEYLAHRISTNVRVLEGALTRLFAFASLVGKTIDHELVQDCLADILRTSDRKITVEEIQRKVAEHYNIRLSDLVGPRRMRSFARPRQVAMWLSKALTTPLPRSARFAGRHTSTILHRGLPQDRGEFAADRQAGSQTISHCFVAAGGIRHCERRL